MINGERPVIFERKLNVLYFLLRPHAVNTHSIYRVAVAISKGSGGGGKPQANPC